MSDHLVPDVFEKLETKNSVTVEYEQGVKVEHGNKLTPTQVQNQPHITWEADPNKLYCVVMTDPDAPSRQDPKFREWLHFLVYNIKGNDLKSGKEFAVYIGSGPPKDTGYHRYVFIVYEQPGEIHPEEPHLKFNGNGRGGFRIETWRKKYNLSEPIAYNYYEAQYDDYVPTLYQKLSENK